MRQKQKMSAHATSGICRVITSFIIIDLRRQVEREKIEDVSSVCIRFN